jgi:hypothetical protein
VKSKSEFEPQIDLLEVRRQLTVTRSLHSNNRRVTIRINNLIGELAHLRQPDDRAHEKLLIRMIAKTMRAVERIISNGQPAKLAPASLSTDASAGPVISAAATAHDIGECVLPLAGVVGHAWPETAPRRRSDGSLH